MNLLEKLPIDDREKMLFDVLGQRALNVEEHHVYDSSKDEEGTYYNFYCKDIVDREVGNKGYRLTIEERFSYINWLDEFDVYHNDLYGQRFLFFVNGHEITLQNFWDFVFMETGRPTTWHPKQLRDFLFKDVNVI